MNSELNNDYDNSVCKLKCELICAWNRVHPYQETFSSCLKLLLIRVNQPILTVTLSFWVCSLKMLFIYISNREWSRLKNSHSVHWSRERNCGQLSYFGYKQQYECDLISMKDNLDKSQNIKITIIWLTTYNCLFFLLSVPSHSMRCIYMKSNTAVFVYLLNWHRYLNLKYEYGKSSTIVSCHLSERRMQTGVFV